MPEGRGFEESDDEGGGFRGKGMSAVVNIGDDGCADFGGIGDLALDGGLGGETLVDAAHGVDHALLPGEFHKVVLAAGEVPNGFGL